MQRQQQGFTLIELVIVIVILGILSAFALPRFADLGGDARNASLQGLAGSLKSAASIAHSKQLTADSGLGADVTLEGADITMVNGYPTADADGIVAAAQVDTTDDYTTNGGGTTGGDTITFELQTNCSVEYQAAQADTDDTAPITSSYSVTINDDGC